MCDTVCVHASKRTRERAHTHTLYDNVCVIPLISPLQIKDVCTSADGPPSMYPRTRLHPPGSDGTPGMAGSHHMDTHTHTHTTHTHTHTHTRARTHASHRAPPGSWGTRGMAPSHPHSCAALKRTNAAQRSQSPRHPLLPLPGRPPYSPYCCSPVSLLHPCCCLPFPCWLSPLASLPHVPPPCPLRTCRKVCGVYVLSIRLWFTGGQSVTGTCLQPRRMPSLTLVPLRKHL